MALGGPEFDWRDFLLEPSDNLSFIPENPDADNVQITNDFLLHFPFDSEPVVSFNSFSATVSPLDLLYMAPLGGTVTSDVSETIMPREPLSLPQKKEETAPIPKTHIEMLLCHEKFSLDSEPETPSPMGSAATASVTPPPSSEASSLSMTESENSGKKMSRRKRQNKEEVESEEDDIARKIKQAEKGLEQAKEIPDLTQRRLLKNQHSAMISRCKKKLREIKSNRIISDLKYELEEVKAENARLKKEIAALEQKKSEETIPKVQGGFEFNFVSEETRVHLLYSPKQDNKVSKERKAVNVKPEPSADVECDASKNENLGSTRPIRYRRKSVRSYQ